MIYSITFNPALDISGDVKNLVLDEKNYVSSEKIKPGGNGVNAGIIAKRLKAQVVLSGFLGGDNGRKLRSLLYEEKVAHYFVLVEAQTRINFTIANTTDHRQTRLSFGGPHIQICEKKSLKEFLKNVIPGDIVIFAGSLPPGVTTSYIRSLIRIVKKREALCLVDMPGHYLKDLIKAKPDFIKPNLKEFQILVGKKVKTIKLALPLAQKMLSSIPNICISSLEGGALMVNKKEVWFGKLPQVDIHSSIGAGDSMVGAMAALMSKRPKVGTQELLRLGLAAACASLTEKKASLGSRSAIFKCKPQMILRKI